MSKRRRTSFDRRTTETQIRGALVLDGQGRYDVRTGIRFLDHMLETIWWRSGFNLSVNVQAARRLEHTIAEDVGITFGRAVRGLYDVEAAEGMDGAGNGRAMLDEALAEVSMSIEGRAGCWFDFE